jgi:hypothetical protein
VRVDTIICAANYVNILALDCRLKIFEIFNGFCYAKGASGVKFHSELLLLGKKWKNIFGD